MKIIARIRTGFPEKFSVPRQSGLVETEGTIVFEPEYRNDDALRGIEQYSHLWLIWDFSENHREDWSPTVRPPKLGGNKRVGVFATRSPFRPNPIGLSSVKLIGTEKSKDGIILKVLGADLMNGTPIYDIKPYLAYTDSHPEAKSGFAGEHFSENLKVNFPEELKNKIPAEKRSGLISALEGDPRPHYIEDDNRIYGFEFSKFEIKFSVKRDILTVLAVEEKN